MSENQLEVLRKELIDRVNRMNEQELNDLMAFFKNQQDDERPEEDEP